MTQLLKAYHLNVLTVPLSNRADRSPVAPVMLGDSRAMRAMPVELSSSITRYCGKGEPLNIQNIQRQLLGGGWTIEGHTEHPQSKIDLLAEMIDQVEAVVGERQVHVFSATVQTMVMPYGKRLGLDRGVHTDNLSDHLGARTFDLIVAAPMTTLSLPTISKQKMIHAGMVGTFINPDYDRHRIVAPRPCQYNILPEHVTHTTPDMTTYCLSYEEALERYAGQPDALRRFRPDGYTRDFATARTCFAADGPR